MCENIFNILTRVKLQYSKFFAISFISKNLQCIKPSNDFWTFYDLSWKIYDQITKKETLKVTFRKQVIYFLDCRSLPIQKQFTLLRKMNSNEVECATPTFHDIELIKFFIRFSYRQVFLHQTLNSEFFMKKIFSHVRY